MDKVRSCSIHHGKLSKLLGQASRLPLEFDISSPFRSHFSLPFLNTLSHTLSELTEFESNVRSRKTAGLRQSTRFCRQGSGLDKYLGQKTCPGGSFVQGHRKHLVESCRSRQTTRYTR